MALIKGPFAVKWGANTIEDIEEIALDYTVNSSDLDTVQGVSYNVRGSIAVSATLTLLSNDIDALAAVLPQYFVPMGDALADGTIVTNTDGAIDIVAASCADTAVANNLVITDCTNTDGGRMTIWATTTDVDSVEFADGVRKVLVTFRGLAPAGQVITFGAPAVTGGES
jgi:hypothetical protein